MKDALCRAQAAGFISQTQREPVREVVRAAGRRIGTPEERVVAFKWLLVEAANEARLPLGRERTDLLERFVTVFIEEMYRVESQGIAEPGCRGTSTGGFNPSGNFAPPAAHQ